MPELILAALFAAAALYLAGSWAAKHWRCSLQVQAEVEAVETAKPGRLRGETKHFYPVYRYFVNGKSYRGRPAEASRTNCWQRGQSVTLWVDPKNPEIFRAGSEAGDLVFAALSAALAALAVAIHFL